MRSKRWTVTRRQTEMFPPPAPGADDELNAVQAEMRLSQLARDATRPPSARRGRHREVKSKTINIRRLSRLEIEIERAVLAAEGEDEDAPRLPRTRGDCIDGPRPC